MQCGNIWDCHPRKVGMLILYRLSHIVLDNLNLSHSNPWPCPCPCPWSWEEKMSGTVNGHKYSSPSILRYIFHINLHFSIFFYCEVISKRILIIFQFFTPEDAEIFKDYLFILAWFSVRLPLFSYDLKTIFVFWRQICYIF